MKQIPLAGARVAGPLAIARERTTRSRDATRHEARLA